MRTTLPVAVLPGIALMGASRNRVALRVGGSDPEL